MVMRTLATVVVPVLEDRAELRRQLEGLAEADELIVVDASTRDSVQPADLPPHARLLTSSRANRAWQQNLGAEVASGEALLFLHADTRLAEGALRRIASTLEDGGVVGGGFVRFFDSPSRFLRITCRLAALRGRSFGWFLGDQAIFVKREAFRDLGGFKILTAFEDYDLCMRLLSEGRVVRDPSHLIVHHGGQAARKGWRHILWFLRGGLRFFNSWGWRWV